MFLVSISSPTDPSCFSTASRLDSINDRLSAFSTISQLEELLLHASTSSSSDTLEFPKESLVDSGLFTSLKDGESTFTDPSDVSEVSRVDSGLLTSVSDGVSSLTKSSRLEKVLLHSCSSSLKDTREFCKEFPTESEFLLAVSISTFTDPSDVLGDSTWDAPLFTRSETKLLGRFL